MHFRFSNTMLITLNSMAFMSLIGKEGIECFQVRLEPSRASYLQLNSSVSWGYDMIKKFK